MNLKYLLARNLNNKRTSTKVFYYPWLPSSSSPDPVFEVSNSTLLSRRNRDEEEEDGRGGKGGEGGSETVKMVMIMIIIIETIMIMTMLIIKKHDNKAFNN